MDEALKNKEKAKMIRRSEEVFNIEDVD